MTFDLHQLALEVGGKRKGVDIHGQVYQLWYINKVRVENLKNIATR
jgi:hypothetical protein